MPVTLFCMEIRILSQIKANYEKDQKCGKEKNSFKAFAFHRLFAVSFNVFLWTIYLGLDSTDKTDTM